MFENAKSGVQHLIPFTTNFKLFKFFSVSAGGRYQETWTGKTIRFNDFVRGDMSFETSDVEDFVILRSDNTPTYHLASTVDDIDYEITIIARGEDILSSTPKHILIMEALNATIPDFCHLPLLFGPDGKKLSKRHGDTSVEAFRKNGILNELTNRVISGINSGQFFSFTIILFFVAGLMLFNYRKNNTALNQTEIFLLLIAIVIFLILVGNFLDRYVNYLPSVLLVNELRKLNN